MTQDPEIDVELDLIHRVLQLDPQARQRVVRYLVARVLDVGPSAVADAIARVQKNRARRKTPREPEKSYPADTVCDVFIRSVPTRTVDFLRAVRTHHTRDLLEAKNMLDRVRESLPYRLWEGVQFHDAQRLAAEFEKTGARMEIRVPVEP